MKGIILAGGKGTRLQPATFAMNKHMVPILNKPMIEYPIATLKVLSVTDILIVSGGNHIGAFAEYLGDGKAHGVNFTYRVQTEAGGIAQALGLAEDWAHGESVAVILGDNIFDDKNFHGFKRPEGATIFLKEVENASRFGVYNEGTIVEKPLGQRKGHAVTGLYFYPPEVFEVVKMLRPSSRGELEITDVNNHFLKEQKMSVRYAHHFWSDAGTPESLYQVTEWAYGKLGLS